MNDDLIYYLDFLLFNSNNSYTMVKVRQWTRPNPFKAQVSEKDLKLDEEDLSENLQPGGLVYYFTSIFYSFLLSSEVLCESVYLTVDPYMRYVCLSNDRKKKTVVSI